MTSMCTRPPLKVGLQCASSDDSDQAPDNMTGAGWTLDQINMRPFAQFRNSVRALIWYWDHLKNFIAEIPQGPLGMSIGTIWVTQKRSQGPPARGF